MSESEPDFGVLGVLEVRVAGVPVEIPAGRQRAILAALLIGRGRPVSPDALIDAAWGNDPPADPLPALYTVVSRLRALLGSGVVRTAPGGYILSPVSGAVDCDRFESLRGLAAKRPAAEAAGLLDTALGLWRGDAYAEFNDRYFAQYEGTRLDELRLATIEDRAAIDLELGLTADAAARLDPVVKRHPYREKALGLLMTALYRAGRTPDALDAYRGYRTTLADELGLDPSPYLSGLQERILGNDGMEGAGSRSLRSRQGSVTAPRYQTTFIGREDDAARLVALAADHRLVCVTGPGGVGKTRLVIESLDLLEQQAGRGAVVADLADLDPAGSGTDDARPDSAVPANSDPEESVPEDGDGVRAVVASALGLEPSVDPSFTALTDYLRARNHLLVLDNCEHIRDAVRAFSTALVRDCPDTPVIATSRVRLGSADEHVLTLEPLDVPTPEADPREAGAASAVRLLVDRVRAADPSFELTGAALGDAVDLCRRLDGLPLAMELAARRAATLGMRPLLERLGAGFDLAAGFELLGGSGPRHQRSLTDVLDWSWELLSPRQQGLLESLSVFRADFELAAVEAVSGGRMVSADLDLAELVEFSLVTMLDDAAGARYRLLETVRGYAAGRLAASGRTDSAMLAHAEWAATVTGQYAAAAAGASTVPGYARLNRIRLDLIAAVRWSVGAGHPEIGAAITGAIGLVPHWRPGVELWSLSLDVAECPGLRRSPSASLALAAAGIAAIETGELARGERLAAEAKQLAAEPRERYLAGLALGIAALYAGRHAQAADRWTEVLESGGLSDGHRADLHASLALLHCYVGHLESARAEAAAARAAADLAGPGAIRAFATYATGEVLAVDDLGSAPAVFREAALEGDRLEADQVALVARIAWFSALTRLGEHRRALELARPLLQGQLLAANWPQLWTTLRTLAGTFAETGHPAQAEFLLAAADAAASAPQLVGPDAERQQGLRRHIHAQLGDPVTANIAALAGSLPRADVVSRAWDALETALAERA